MPDKKNIFFDLQSYGMGRTFELPDIEKTIDLSQILCIGGGIMLIPFKEGASITISKDPSVFVANNNSTYIDDYIPKPIASKYKTFIPKDFSLVSYVKLYVIFRTVYRRSGFDDYFDIFINILKDKLDQNIKQPNVSDYYKKITEFLLGFIDLLQKGFTSDAVDWILDNEEILENSKISITENPSLKQQFDDEITSLLNEYTSLYTSFLLAKGSDIVNSWTSKDTATTLAATKLGSPKPLFSAINNIGDFVKNAAESLVTVDGQFLELFYRLMETTWKYVQTPMPIHIPNKGWVYGYVQDFTLSHEEKKFNIYPVEVVVVQREISNSTFVDVNQINPTIPTTPTLPKDEKKKPQSCGLGSRDAFLAAAKKNGYSISSDQYDQYCRAYSSPVGNDIDQTLEGIFSSNVSYATLNLSLPSGNSAIDFNANSSTKLAISMSKGGYADAQIRVNAVTADAADASNAAVGLTKSVLNAIKG